MDLEQEKWKNGLENDSDSLILDVRTTEEFETSRIPNSVNIDFYNPEIFKISFWTMINSERTNDDFKTTIENMLSKSGWRKKYAYKLIIEASNLTQKEKEILEFPYID